MEVAVVKQEVSHKNYLTKLHVFKKELHKEISWIEGRDLCLLMGKLAHYHYNKRRFILLGRDKEVYDFVLKKRLNPYTLYRWLLLERIPEDIKHQLKDKELSQKKAISMAFKRRQETSETISLSVQELGLNLIRGM
jgi:hypothetical protein